jgi:hypothetical protein
MPDGVNLHIRCANVTERVTACMGKRTLPIGVQRDKAKPGFGAWNNHHWIAIDALRLKTP